MSLRPEDLCLLAFCTQHELLFGTSAQVLIEFLQRKLIFPLAASVRIGRGIQRFALLLQGQRFPSVVAKETDPPTGLHFPGPHPPAPSTQR